MQEQRKLWFKLRGAGFLLVTLAGLSACTQFTRKARTQPTGDERPFGVFSSDRLELTDISDFFKRVFGAADGDYWTNWDQLNQFTQGGVFNNGTQNRIPYLDSWYPEKGGGTNINGALSRYDRAFHGGVSTAAKWERDNHSRQEPSWYGHCNGTSVAASRYQNPTRTVQRPIGCESNPSVSCISFSPADIRALLSEISMNTKAKFISGNRCRLSQEEIESRPALRSDPTVMDACDDVNPGSFHVSLVNFLGRKKQPLIFDYNKDEEVWNYPIYGYSYTAEGPLTEEQAVQRLGLNVNSWVFNPDARSWQFITMTISYRKAVGNFTGAGTKPIPATITYTYLLELGDDGEVLGGEWVGASRLKHPDFLWMPFEPSEPSGAQSKGNPHISNEEVISLWADSVGFDRTNPFQDKPKNFYDVRFYPRSEVDWGRVPGYYQISLDGSKTGSLFLGKTSYLKLEVEEPLENEAQVNIALNGQSLGDFTPKNGVVDLTINSPQGVNYLDLKWTSSKVSSSEIDWQFRYFAL